jgi:hypothetical protein
VAEQAMRIVPQAFAVGPARREPVERAPHPRPRIDAVDAAEIDEPR